jgi:hypothetical protein
MSGMAMLYLQIELTVQMYLSTRQINAVTEQRRVTVHAVEVDRLVRSVDSIACGARRFKQIFLFVAYITCLPVPQTTQDIPAGKVNILGGHNTGHSKQCICTCVLFRTVSEIELFHCTVAKLLIRKRYYVLFLMPVFIVQVTKLVQFT